LKGTAGSQTGGGRVPITFGMLRLLSAEQDVAAVLGHVTGHHLARHIGRWRA
jgi:predicted Zn-dependent protease